MKSSASMCESSSLHFFRANTGTQSGLDVIDESRLVIIFLTKLGVTYEISEGARFSKQISFIRCRR